MVFVFYGAPYATVDIPGFVDAMFPHEIYYQLRWNARQTNNEYEDFYGSFTSKSNKSAVEKSTRASDGGLRHSTILQLTRHEAISSVINCDRHAL